MTIEFYSTKGDFGCFSNFSHHPVNIKGKHWNTSEHYFQAQKFSLTKYEEQIRKCSSASEAAKMGRDRSLPLRTDWELVKDNIMREAVLMKFSQNASCLKTLLSTGDQRLVEHTVNDKYWADGGNGTGKNMLGIILMEVRSILKQEDFKMARFKYIMDNKLENIYAFSNPVKWG